MALKVTITLDESILSFVDREAGADNVKANRSAFINAVLVRERQRRLESALAEAHQRDSEDPEYLQEVEAWDGVVGDGMHA